MWMQAERFKDIKIWLENFVYSIRRNVGLSARNGAFRHISRWTNAAPDVVEGKIKRKSIKKKLFI